MKWYGLDGQPCSEEEAFRILANPMLRAVACTWIGEWVVSTTFLVVDHSFGSGGPPLLWESMTFDPSGDTVGMRRYSSREAASTGHDEMVAELKAWLADLDAMVGERTER